MYLILEIQSDAQISKMRRNVGLVSGSRMTNNGRRNPSKYFYIHVHVQLNIKITCFWEKIAFWLYFLKYSVNNPLPPHVMGDNNPCMRVNNKTFNSFVKKCSLISLLNPVEDLYSLESGQRSNSKCYTTFYWSQGGGYMNTPFPSCLSYHIWRPIAPCTWTTLGHHWSRRQNGTWSYSGFLSVLEIVDRCRQILFPDPES